MKSTKIRFFDEPSNVSAPKTQPISSVRWVGCAVSAAAATLLLHFHLIELDWLIRLAVFVAFLTSLLAITDPASGTSTREVGQDEQKLAERDDSFGGIDFVTPRPFNKTIGGIVMDDSFGGGDI